MEDPTPDPGTDPETLALVKAFVDWDNFEEDLRERNRHFATRLDYLNSVVSDCQSCVYTLMRGFKLFRARIVPLHLFPTETPLHAADLASPPKDLASAGRLNPEGIPYFYAAFDEATAIAEVRPWIGAQVTVGEYLTRKAYDVIDLTGKYTSQFRSPIVKALSHLFGRPIHRDDKWGYLGTQYLSERLKMEAIHGLLYDSAMKPGGVNFAHFGSLDLLPSVRTLFRIDNVAHGVTVIERAADG